MIVYAVAAYMIVFIGIVVFRLLAQSIREVSKWDRRSGP